MSHLYWSNLPEREPATWEDKHLVQLVRHRQLADPRITGHEHELQRAFRHDPVEGSEQSVDLALAPMQSLGDKKTAGASSFLSRASDPGLP
jgi:hypothetical protein